MPTIVRKEKKDERKRQPTSNRRLYTLAAWKKLRHSKLLQNPNCEVCEHYGILTDCTSNSPIDHAIRIDNGGAELDIDNLMTMCKFHHDAKSRFEAHGFAPDAKGEYGFKTPTAAGKLQIFEKLKYI